VLTRGISIASCTAGGIAGLGGALQVAGSLVEGTQQIICQSLLGHRKSKDSCLSASQSFCSFAHLVALILSPTFLSAEAESDVFATEISEGFYKKQRATFTN
jgi:hypothetical protein